VGQQDPSSSVCLSVQFMVGVTALGAAGGVVFTAPQTSNDREHGSGSQANTNFAPVVDIATNMTLSAAAPQGGDAYLGTWTWAVGCVFCVRECGCAPIMCVVWFGRFLARVL
jgi:hypothetical protein